MSVWPPTCSQDVTQAREDAAEVEAQRPRREAVEALLHARYCQDGWLGDDDQGRPVPCLVCRPGVRERLERSRGMATA